MKIMGLTLLMLGLTAVAVRAEECRGVKGNPDCCISVGLDFTKSVVPSSSKDLGPYPSASGHLLLQTTQISNQTATVDLRIPMYSWLTLNAHGGPWRQDFYDSHANGYTLGGGVRVYLTGRWFNE